MLSAPPLTSRGPRLADARKLVRLISRWRPLRVSADDAVGRGHHWRISGGWDAGQQRWEVRIDPGFVNGQEVLCPSQPIEEVPEATLERLKAAGGDLPARAQAWLSEGPSIGISRFRAVGTDAVSVDGSGEEVPEYFLEAGVAPAEAVSTAGDTLTRTETANSETARTRRLLRCCDVVLNQPRPSARLEVGADNRPEARLVLPGDTRPFLTVQPDRYQPPGEAGSIQEEFAGALADSGLDRLLIGRLWLLSPAGLAPGSPPDVTWQALGQNEVFYSLDHDVNVDINVIEPLDLGFTIPLAGGVAQLTIAGLTEEMQRNDAYASAFLSRARVTGAFRTV
jgi:hypothetical protein